MKPEVIYEFQYVFIINFSHTKLRLWKTTSSKLNDLVWPVNVIQGQML